MSKLIVGPIKDFALGIFDGPHATPKESEEGPVFLGIKNVTPDGRLDFSDIRHVSEQEFPKWTRRVTPQADDIVFSYEATLHRYAIIPEDFCGCLGRRMALIRPNKDKVYPRFLHYYFLTPQWRALIEANIVSGATVDRIPIKKFPEYEIRLPDRKIQATIASILSAYDDLIENNRRRIQLLEEAARLLYKEWFVRLRFPGHEHVKIKDGVPEGWGRKPLGEIAPLNYGKGLKQDNRIPGAFPVYGSSGIIGTHIKALVEGPGIIVGRKGTVGSVYWSDEAFYPIDTVYFIGPEKSTLYLYYALLNTAFISTDVAVPGLNRDFAHSRNILIPESNIANLFEEIVSTIHKQIHGLRKYNKSLAKARDLLLPRLMNGEIAV
jgi:type I restriction enzyme S subunit